MMTRQEMIDRYANVPEELKKLDIWACWSGRYDDYGHVDMTPCDPAAEDPTDIRVPDAPTSFRAAIDGCVINGFKGVGIMVDDPYFCVVIDGADNASDAVDEIVGSLDSYNETSANGTGVVVLSRGTCVSSRAAHPEIGNGVAMEMFSGGRFVPLSGLPHGTACNRITDCSDSGAAVLGKYMSNGGVAMPGSGSDYDMTDSGNAMRLRDMYGDKIRYCYTAKNWYVWDGRRWAPNDAGQIKQLADNVIHAMRAEAAKISGGKDADKKRAELTKFIRKTENHINKEHMLKECQHLSGIPVMAEDLDNEERTAGLINARNGIINLRTGEMLPHDPALMMTKICGTDYDTTHAKPEKFLKFLDDITSGNKEMQAYLKRCVGYTLTGTGSEKCMFILHGMGNNGKSTLSDVLATMLGSYGTNIQADSLLCKGREIGGRGATGDIARLKSTRMVTCQEPDEGARIKEGLLKQMTGFTDKITARFLFEREFDFYPRCAIWLSANHKPIIRGTDKGIWNRIRLIPFEVDIKDVDKELPQKLRKELPQILAWAVEGAQEWYKHGLQTPDIVANATAEYRSEMDLVASFVDQCLEIDYNSNERVLASDMFAAYISWARANNEYEMTSKRFGMELTKKVPSKGRDKRGNYYAQIKFSEYGKQFVTRQYTAAQFK